MSSQSFRLPACSTAPIIGRAAASTPVRKLDPRKLARNPVIFVTEVGLGSSSRSCSCAISSPATALPLFTGQIAAWLWFTVLFANFAEAVAEGRGKAQADALRRTRSDTRAKRLVDPEIGRPTIRASTALDLQRRRRRAGRSRRSHPRATARSSKASPRSMNRRSPANPRR